MSYTSPSPQFVSLNGNQTTWWIPARNLSSLKSTNVTVQVNITPVGGLSPVTYVAEKGVFNYTTGIWQIGDLLPGETKWLKIITQVADIGLAPFTMTSVISGSGVDPNNVNNTLVQTLTSVVTSATAGAIDDPNSCYCGDVSLNDTLCNYGETEWVLDPNTVTNSVVYTWDNATGKYRFTPVSLTQDITASYSIWCGNVEISGPATLTIPALIDDVNQFNHTIETKSWANLTAGQKTFIESLYPGVEWAKFGWSILLNGAGEITSALQIDINEKQNTKFIPLCVETACTAEPSPCIACPQGSLPNNVLALVDAITDYTPQEGDSVFVQHSDGYTVHTFVNGTWTQWPCGCIIAAEGGGTSPYPTGISVMGTTNKTITISMSSGAPITTTFTDLDTDENTTYTFSVVGSDLIVTPSVGAPQTIALPSGADDWGTQVIQHAACSPASGDGTLLDPLVVDVPVARHVFNNTTIAPGVVGASVVDVGILFATPCDVGCTPTYTLGGFPSLVYENVTLVGATLTYDVKANAPSGNSTIVINRTCA